MDKKTFLLRILQTFVISFTLTIAITLAWTEPSASPPGGNVAAPLNVSDAPQVKRGSLILNTGGAEIGLIVAAGNVGIGTGSRPPAGKFEIAGNRNFYIEIGTVDGHQTPRCSCDRYNNIRECEGSFETTHPVGNICYDQYTLSESETIVGGLPTRENTEITRLSVKFQVQNVPLFIVSQSGNIGISTSNPTADLDVKGIIKATGFGRSGCVLVDPHIKGGDAFCPPGYYVAGVKNHKDNNWTVDMIWCCRPGN
jgi:hypothetical protein